jgi:asparagine synthase (glutamine-hydrolysing)
MRVTGGAAEAALISRLYAKTEALGDTLSKTLYIDTRMSLSDNLLLFNDKMTMASSLEMRVPYLDLDLVGFVESLPPQLKFRALTGKYIHKRAAMAWLPKEVVYRRKRNFGTPMDAWLQSDLAPIAQRIVSRRDSACHRYFNVPYVQELITSHRERRQNYERQIFTLLSFEFWYKACVQHEPIDREVFKRQPRRIAV